FMTTTTMEMEGGVGIIDLPMVWDFSEDFSDVPSKREAKFTNVLPDIRPVSVVP
ncbi:hypothetical protein A2U01_0096258, partial [Trifolium medium]|nr:hypothetical protein [Trifolium medium]